MVALVAGPIAFSVPSRLKRRPWGNPRTETFLGLEDLIHKEQVAALSKHLGFSCFYELCLGFMGLRGEAQHKRGFVGGRTQVRENVPGPG